MYKKAELKRDGPTTSLSAMAGTCHFKRKETNDIRKKESAHHSLVARAGRKVFYF